MLASIGPGFVTVFEPICLRTINYKNVDFTYEITQVKFMIYVSEAIKTKQKYSWIIFPKVQYAMSPKDIKLLQQKFISFTNIPRYVLKCFKLIDGSSFFG